MARSVHQVRWFGDGNKDSNTTSSQLVNGSAFSQYAIVQLGIQTLPGTKFSINLYPTPLIIGATGIYELDLTNIGRITNLLISKTSLDNIKNSGQGLIIDFISETE